MTRPARYLIVEDDDDHAALIERNLRRASPTSDVERLGDGVSVLKYLRREAPYHNRRRPDVLLLDLKLPGLNGLQVLEKIKADRDLCTIPVVMLTTSAADRDRTTAYEKHVNSYLVKPLDFAGFRQVVTEICHYWGEVNCPVSD